MKPKSEEIRLRYLYRNLILNGKARLSFEAARRLIGPDCAYHLYGAVRRGEKASIINQSKHPAGKSRRERNPIKKASR